MHELEKFISCHLCIHYIKFLLLILVCHLLASVNKVVSMSMSNMGQIVGEVAFYLEGTYHFCLQGGDGGSASRGSWS